MTSANDITITGKVSLDTRELAEVLALKSACDALEHLDLKLGYGAPDPAAATYPAVLLARAGDRLIGYCSLDGDATTVEICIMVHPEWRRWRLGLRLFETARANFKGAGGDQMFAVCEDASASGRVFLRMLATQRAFSEHRMRWRGAQSTPRSTTVTDGAPDAAAFTVERARPEDYQSLAATLGRAFNMAETRLLADLTSASAVATEQVYVARLDGTLVGGFRLSILPDSTGIYAFGVDPSYQRRGLGRRMLAQACTLATRQGAKRVTLEVDTDNVAAIALYRSGGFEIITTYGYYIFSPTLLAVGLTLDPGDQENSQSR
ncbi:MAG TPA: GNAT family N-acetyltransferase [Ktedonobacterales bacterium]|nr:GNAT family N-acetyltransferase [Ktedonobacterales bacterium]